MPSVGRNMNWYNCHRTQLFEVKKIIGKQFKKNCTLDLLA